MSEKITTTAYAPAAEIARANGWGVGDVLEGTEYWPDGGGVTTQIVLTAVGERSVLARTLRTRRIGAAEFTEQDGRECSWVLDCREWRRVADGQRPVSAERNLAEWRECAEQQSGSSRVPSSEAAMTERISVTVTLAWHHCFDCGRHWAVEDFGSSGAKCPLCAGRRIAAAQAEADRAHRVAAGLRGAMKRAKAVRRG